VRQQNRRSDLVKERRTGVLVALLGFFIRQYGLDLRRIERVKDGIALFALVRVLSRPRRVLLAQLPSLSIAVNWNCSFSAVNIRVAPSAG
jgi:hypothetical protein